MTTKPLFLTVLWLALLPAAQAQSGLLMRTPTMNRTHIVFSYAGDLWSVPRQGGAAERLTSSPGTEIRPLFSPDGLMIAFTGEIDGNFDVYVMPAAGGVPQRLTYHPGPDEAVAWTRDGKSILSVSDRHNANDGDRLYMVPVGGGFPVDVPLPTAEEGSYSPDGAKLAYVPVFHWQPAWKRYRGGQTLPIWIATLADSHVEPLPRENSNDFDPMWVGDTIYFLSDRNGPVTLFSYDTQSRKVTQLVENHGLDMKSASAGPGGIVYEQFGGLYIYDFATRKEHPVDIQIAADFPEVRPHFQKITAQQMDDAKISPTGARAVFEANGEILTVPAEKGDFRNITKSPAAMDRTPSWSPDGKWIAWFSDEPGHYALFLRDQSGLGDVKKIDLGEPHSFYYSPAWSSDSKKLTFTDKWLNLWYVDIATGAKVKVDTNTFDDTQTDMNPVWSPDSRWIAYTKILPTFFHVVEVYSLDTGKATQVTDGMSDAQYPVFDKSGKYLYFVASTNLGMAAGGGGGNLSALERPVTSSAWVMVLRKDLPSPLAPESDDEKVAKPGDKKSGDDAKKDGDSKDAANDATKDAAKDAVKGKEPPKVTIDFDGISQRVLALPVPEKNYTGLAAGKEGVLFLWSGPIVALEGGSPEGPIDRFDLTKRKVEPFVGGVQAFDVSASGEKILFKQKNKWFITKTEAAPKAGDGELKLEALEVWVEPRAEWKQMYHETWRIEREFLYTANFNGLDIGAAEAKYAPYLDKLDSRADLNYLFTEMLGELTLGHVFVGGGEMPEVKPMKTGLLGADYAIENGRYRFTRIFDGENWNPQLHAPLTQPGVDVKVGDYLLAVQGRDVTSADNLFSFFLETAGRQTVLKVGPNADGTGAREVTVVPVEDEHGLRHRAWVEDNRRKVDAATGGRAAYVHLPDTAYGGYNSFNRYYYAQSDKQAAVIDERYNHGGELADYIVENLNIKPLSLATLREGRGMTMPAANIYGPKVMIINQFAGSGGDALPWYFRKLGIGPLVGTRTWGGLVGIGGYPKLMDGGRVTAPRFAIYGLNGQWEVENHGITPDYEVELDPAAWRQGHDTQLDKAIEVLLDLLKKNPPKTYPKPAYPNYHQQ